MAVRLRADGRILCAAMHPAEQDDVYVDDGLHYELSIERHLLVTEHADKHSIHGEWWWCWNVPENVTIDYWWRTEMPNTYRVENITYEAGGAVLQVKGPDDFSYVCTNATLNECIEEVLQEVGGYDSEAATREHMQKVSNLLTGFAIELLKRGAIHDWSKLEVDEKPYFDAETPKLKELPYGSDAYKESLGRLKVALDHHYRCNSHHPEHYEHGVNGMDLFDVVEMVMDWKAANERGPTPFHEALRVSFKRFDIDPQLKDIIVNTVHKLGWFAQHDEENLKGLEFKGTVADI